MIMLITPNLYDVGWVCGFWSLGVKSWTVPVW